MNEKIDNTHDQGADRSADRKPKTVEWLNWPDEVVLRVSLRGDGGLRICSDTLPGLILSHGSPDRAMAAVLPAIHALLENDATVCADRKPREVRGDLIERAKRAVVALRTPDHSLANVANTIRQSIADAIEAQQRWIDRYGLALMMIREGCVDPEKFADETLSADVTAISALNTIVVTPEMEAAGREWARAHDPSTFADIFAAMWRARPDPHGREATALATQDARIKEQDTLIDELATALTALRIHLSR